MKIEIEFGIGTIVIHKVGHQEMVVDKWSSANDEYSCSWVDKDNKPRSDVFPGHVLVKPEPPQEWVNDDAGYGRS